MNEWLQCLRECLFIFSVVFFQSHRNYNTFTSTWRPNTKGPVSFFFQNHKAAWKIRDQKCSSSIAAESLFYAMASPQLELAFCEDFASGKLHDPYTNHPRKHEKEPDQERWSCRFGNWIRSILLNGCWVKTTMLQVKVWNHPNGCFRFQAGISDRQLWWHWESVVIWSI